MGSIAYIHKQSIFTISCKNKITNPKLIIAEYIQNVLFNIAIPSQCMTGPCFQHPQQCYVAAPL